MNIEYELQALHRNLKSALGSYYVTRRQVGALVYLMLQGLPDRKDRPLRIAVLREWIGEPMKTLHNIDVQSTKNITGPMASFLIEILSEPNNPEMILSKYGHKLIEATARYVQSTNSTNQVIGQPKTKTKTSVSGQSPVMGS